MNRLITHCSFLGIVLFLFCCTSGASQGVVSQRSIATRTFEDGVKISLTFGTLKNLDQIPIVARAASSQLEITIRSGAFPSGPREVEIQNIHPNAELRVEEVIVLTSENEDGCPFGESVFVSCEEAKNTLTKSCKKASDCGGNPCENAHCVASAAYDLCSAPAIEKSDENRTTLNFTYDVQACRRLKFIAKNKDKAPKKIRVGVVGKLEYPENSTSSLDFSIFEELATLTKEEDLEFLVFLGNLTPLPSTEGLNLLSTHLNNLPVPVVVLAGDKEAIIDNGGPFLRRFGPHEQVFSTPTASFVTFFSATGSLGEVGFRRIDTLLAQTRRRRPDLPIIAFTHTPPIDIVGERMGGFRNPLEGARVHGILNRYDVRILFAGSTILPGKEKLGNLELHLVGDTDSSMRDKKEILILNLGVEGEISVERKEF